MAAPCWMCMNRRWLATAQRKLAEWKGVGPMEAVYRSRIARIDTEILACPPCTCGRADDLLSSDAENEESAA
jgi:hypothetical protein